MHDTIKTVPKLKPVGFATRLGSGVSSFLKRNGLCIATVIVPTALSIIYFGFIASKIYTSESSFVMRSPHLQSSTSGLGSLLQSTGLTGFSGETDDAYTVEGFILSRDALRQLNDKFDLRSAWANDQIDFFHRFGLYGYRNNFEYLYLYYQDRIQVEIDTHSNMINLKVSVFSADQAQQINEQLLQAAESLVNTLNDRARQDLISYAAAEVDGAKKEVETASLALSEYRNQQGIVDPQAQSTVNFELISKLQDELISTKTSLASLQAFAPDSPNPPALELRAKTLQAAIDTELGKVAGNNDSLSSKDARYEQLALERGFGEQRLATALTSLQTARDDAQRQQLYLEVVAKPIRPDVAIEPKRIEGIVVTFIVGLVLWGISSMLVAGIREHQL